MILMLNKRDVFEEKNYESLTENLLSRLWRAGQLWWGRCFSYPAVYKSESYSRQAGVRPCDLCYRHQQCCDGL
jgi:hypothetical protein